MRTIPTLGDCNLGLRRSPITTLKKKRAVHWWTEVVSRSCRSQPSAVRELCKDRIRRLVALQKHQGWSPIHLEVNPRRSPRCPKWFELSRWRSERCRIAVAQLQTESEKKKSRYNASRGKTSMEEQIEERTKIGSVFEGDERGKSRFHNVMTRKKKIKYFGAFKNTGRVHTLLHSILLNSQSVWASNAFATTQPRIRSTRSATSEHQTSNAPELTSVWVSYDVNDSIEAQMQNPTTLDKERKHSPETTGTRPDDAQNITVQDSPYLSNIENGSFHLFVWILAFYYSVVYFFPDFLVTFVTISSSSPAGHLIAFDGDIDKMRILLPVVQHSEGRKSCLENPHRGDKKGETPPPDGCPLAIVMYAVFFASFLTR
ncbi:hypothetical protein DFH08DRAFT_818709 [Mycena albidolilacea]|uniref:Uncharacterized protein n=1 Tax=Mycena albidolilacea TaxID=1033008 RepID=A0AAD6ZFU1_9AGAR|nr:hypothetical protein DFH08DRAFT_818709 [Mycena albidolilacea]